MIFDQVKIIEEKKNDTEILLVLQVPNLVYVKIRNTLEDTKNIEIYRITTKIEDFYLQPLIENIFKIQNIENYDIEITIFDELDSFFVLRTFSYVMTRYFNISFDIEELRNEIKITVNGNVIYNTNVLIIEEFLNKLIITRC